MSDDPYIDPGGDACEAENVELRAEVERLRVIRDKQRGEIEWLHERLHHIFLIAQRSEKARP